MAIGVQTTNTALLALQTLNQLNQPSQSGQAAGAAPSGDGADAGVSVVADAGAQALSVDHLGAVTSGLDRASSITDAALAAGQTVGDLLGQMKALAGGGSQQDFASLLTRISTAVSGAGFDGVNLLDGSAGPSVAVGSGSGGAVTLAAYDLTIGGPLITVDSASQNTSADVLTGLDASIANVGQALGQIGDQQRQLQSHALFISRLSDVLALGSGANAPPTSADGARLMALQVQQQLAAQGGGIANSAPQVLLSLFK